MASVATCFAWPASCWALALSPDWAAAWAWEIRSLALPVSVHTPVALATTAWASLMAWVVAAAGCCVAGAAAWGAGAGLLVAQPARRPTANISTADCFRKFFMVTSPTSIVFLQEFGDGRSALKTHFCGARLALRQTRCQGRSALT